MQQHPPRLLDQRQRFANAAAMQQCSSDDSKLQPQPLSRYRAELDARARVLRAAPASAGASAAAAANTATLATSPVTSSSCRGAHRASSVHEAPRSTRALLSRLFRSSSLSAKSKRSSRSSSQHSDTADGGSDSERPQSFAPVPTAAMDAMHLRDRLSVDGAQELDSAYDCEQQHQQQESDSDRHDRYYEHYHHHSHYYPAPATDAFAPATVHVPMRKVLVQGYLTKLPGHKYWHAKPTYFVLEECVRPPATLSVTLRQFRKHDDALARRADGVLSELALSPDDVVVDISSDHATHAWELQCAPSKTRSSVVQTLRLAAPDALALEHWIRIVGTAIAKLIVAAHAPSSAGAKSHEASGGVGAKVAPILSDNNSDDGDGDYSSRSCSRREEIRAAEQDGAAHSEGDDEEKPQCPLPTTPAYACERIGMSATTVAVELGDCRTPLRRCRSCHQWLPFDCDEDEQTSCCGSRASERSSDTMSNPHTHDGGDNNDDSLDNNNDEDDCARECQSDAATDDGFAPRERSNSHSSSSSGGGFASPLSSPSSSSDQSLTPSGSPTPRSTFGSADGVHSTRANAFANFIVSPNPPAQLMSAAVVSSKFDAPLDSESELKAPSTALARVSSSATAFLRARFGRGASPSPRRAPPLPPMHSFTANGQVFTLETRYKLIKSIGTGAYGAVIAVQDAVHDVGVAVKKITNIFDDLVDAKRILREVRLLHHFEHKNITRLLDLAPPLPSLAKAATLSDMYLITELMETDLHQVIYSMQPMSDDHVKYFLYQMLCALHHIHSAGVIHRDMKPSNVLLNSNCDLKICDFGLARGGVAPTPLKRDELTEYVVTRWYRAPEIMLNCLQYTAAIDVWAVGCIFAEMLLREPLFPGNDYIHQLKLIIKFLGTPKQEDTAFVKNAKALRFLTKLPIAKPRKWTDVFASGSGDDGTDVNPLAVDLLSQMLRFNPAKRISVADALRHPYLETFYDPADVTTAPTFDFSFDLPDDQLSKEALVALLYEDIAHFHPLEATTAATSSSSRFFPMGTTASAS